MIQRLSDCKILRSCLQSSLERGQRIAESLAGGMGDCFIRQLPSQHLLCALGLEDLTAALRKHPSLQDRLDRPARIDGGKQNMPRAGPGAEQRESSHQGQRRGQQKERLTLEADRPGFQSWSGHSELEKTAA